MNSDEYAFKAGQAIPGHDWIVVAPIGAGGMGEVYEVRGAHIDRRYVLKTLLKELRGDEMAVKRFYAEAKFLGSMKHEKIVDILATGVTFDEFRQPFFVMEKVYGSTLNVLLKVATKLDLAYACDVFAQIAHALHVVHENGVIHGDVKPLNIMFQQGGAGLESVKLLDFGIARRREPTATSDLSAKMGTPRYTPPEQARGEKLTPAADIYALAVILYEAVSQKYPWPDAVTDENLVHAHLRVPPQPLESHGDYPAPLCDLVRRALAKSPRERPQSMAVVEAELKAIASELRGQPPRATADCPTLRRILAGAPTTGRDRTFSAGNGVKSELIGGGDEGETQDLVAAAPRQAEPAQESARQRTVRMVLPVNHAPIVVVGAAEAPVSDAHARPAEHAPSAPPVRQELESILKTSFPMPSAVRTDAVDDGVREPPTPAGVVTSLASASRELAPLGATDQLEVRPRTASRYFPLVAAALLACFGILGAAVVVRTPRGNGSAPSATPMVTATPPPIAIATPTATATPTPTATPSAPRPVSRAAPTPRRPAPPPAPSAPPAKPARPSSGLD